MEIYRPLYKFSIVHDYFDGGQCPFVACRLSPEGERLARQRKLLFRQIGEGTWTILYDRNADGIDTDHDVLELQLHLTDPNFVYCTDWPNFHPASAYELALPQLREEQEAAKAICVTDRRREMGEGFCTVRLTLSSEMVEAAQKGKPMRALLHFCAPCVKWEYLIFSRSGDVPEGMMLEDTTGMVEFSAFCPQEAYGRPVFLTRSTNAVPMRYSYPCRLRLVCQDSDGRRPKRILLRYVNPPEPGRFFSDEEGFLRQVCYF